ncbi:small membrane protein YoaI [unidentified bacterial endosymbiont]|nr:small membrane protein YoaI [unidentified bacterial endosymbiont]
MHDQMSVETLVISSSFLTIAIVLVASVLILEKKG